MGWRVFGCWLLAFGSAGAPAALYEIRHRLQELWGSQSWLQPPFRRLFAPSTTVGALKEPAVDLRIIIGRHFDAGLWCRLETCSGLVTSFGARADRPTSAGWRGTLRVARRMTS